MRALSDAAMPIRPGKWHSRLMPPRDILMVAGETAEKVGGSCSRLHLKLLVMSPLLPMFCLALAFAPLTPASLNELIVGFGRRWRPLHDG